MHVRARLPRVQVHPGDHVQGPLYLFLCSGSTRAEHTLHAFHVKALELEAGAGPASSARKPAELEPRG